MELYPYITGGIVDVLNSNQIKLKKISLNLVDDEQMESSLQNLIRLTSTETVEALYIRCIEIQIGFMGFGLWLNNLSNILVNLTELSIYVEDLSFIVPIVQCPFVGKIEKLHFHSVDTNLEEVLELLTKIEQVRISQIQELRLTLSIISGGVSDDSRIFLISTKRLFRFILESCPFLQCLNLKRNICSHSSDALTLNFRHHIHLKILRIRVYGCAYFEFNGGEQK